MNRKASIFIHEGDVLIRELLERWLGEAGYAICAPGEGPPSLVIADVPNPRPAQSLIHSLKEMYAVPILVLSGRFRRGLSGSAEAARQLGVEKVLPKPFTRKELLTAVAASLKEH